VAIYQQKGNTNRKRLEELIPLSTPFRVLIDTATVCNFRCKFCPRSEVLKLHGGGGNDTRIGFKMHR